MSIAKHVDRFDRVDGPIGSNYTTVCGAVEIFDEAVWPIEVLTTGSPDVINPNSAYKVQSLLTFDVMDRADYAVLAAWHHVDVLAGIQPISQLMVQATQDPSFTVLARMTKDPLLVDLERTRIGGSARSYEFDPTCFDQGYGLRVTCPRDGSAPILKIVKFSPPVIGPGVPAPQTATEVDKARVLAQVTLTANNLHVTDPNNISTYRGNVQWMRLRVRRADDQVVLDAFFNERNMNVPILTVTDRTQALWGAKGVPGIEFLQAVLAQQTAGTSPFTQRGIPVMACDIFEVETVQDFTSPRVTTPSNFMTYSRVGQRVALLVEKDGNTDFTATSQSQARLNVYLDFVYEAEQEILRKEGYWKFLERTSTFFLIANQASYELPENLDMTYGVQRITAPTRPYPMVLQSDFRISVPNPAETGAIPQIAIQFGVGPNGRPVLHFQSIPNALSDGVEVEVDYYARWIRPSDPASEIPLIPQQHIDVLIYKAAALAGSYATSAQKVVQWDAAAGQKLMDLIRWNNRKIGRQTVMRHVMDTPDPSLHSLYPLTRAAQLSQNFFLR